MPKFSHYIFILLSLSLFSCGVNNPYSKEYDMSNPAKPIPNLITGGQPSEKDLQKLASEGVQTIVNLRAKDEFDKFDEKSLVESLGMEYVSIEMEGSGDISKETAHKLDAILNQGKNTLVHCASSNRVGGLLAYRAYLIQKQPLADALAFGEQAGMGSSEKQVRKLVKRDAKP